jgi:hypothetical protein
MYTHDTVEAMIQEHRDAILKPAGDVMEQYNNGLITPEEAINKMFEAILVAALEWKI